MMTHQKMAFSNRFLRRAGLSALAIAAAASLALSGCSSSQTGSQDDPSGASAEAPTLAMLLYDSSDTWMAAFADAAQEKAEELGVNLSISDGKQDLAVQIGQVGDAVARGVDAILIQPIDADGVVAAVNQAAEQGIDIFAVNSQIGEGAQKNLVTFVGADHGEMGAGTAELAHQALPNGGKLAYIEGIAGNPNTEQRREGFQEVIKNYPEIELVTTVADGFTVEGNIAAVQDLLAKYPEGTLDVIVSQSGALYAGAEYAASIGRADVKFIAMDLPEQIHQGIANGIVFGTVNQDPRDQGAESVQVAYDWLTGNQGAVERPRQLTELQLVTADNVGSFTASWRL